MDRGWIGIKAATAGQLNSVFDPVIECGAIPGELSAGLAYGEAYGYIYPLGATTDSTFGNGKGWKMTFMNKKLYEPSAAPTPLTEWYTRVRFPIDRWNTTAATAANIPYYLGEYDLILRYKTTDIGDAKIGIRAATGYADMVNPTFLERLYITNTDNEFRTVNLGRMRIGGEGWTRDTRRKRHFRK